jgi:hypothetical protein
MQGEVPEKPTLSRLRRCSPEQLEALYAEERSFVVPTGAYRGVHLAWLDTPGARHPLARSLEKVGFYWVPFGVDFTARQWFFFDRRFGIGRFWAQPGPSRWRETETICLHYDISHLPRAVRGILYDEVKPLSTSLCLGIGGINAPRGRGDHFFFALAPLPPKVGRPGAASA